MGEPVAVSIFKHSGKVSDRFVNIGESNLIPFDNHRDHITAYDLAFFLRMPLHLQHDKKLPYPLSLPTQ